MKQKTKYMLNKIRCFMKRNKIMLDFIISCLGILIAINGNIILFNQVKTQNMEVAPVPYFETKFERVGTEYCRKYVMKNEKGYMMNPTFEILYKFKVSNHYNKKYGDIILKFSHEIFDQEELTITQKSKFDHFKLMDEVEAQNDEISIVYPDFLYKVTYMDYKNDLIKSYYETNLLTNNYTYIGDDIGEDDAKIIYVTAEDSPEEIAESIIDYVEYFLFEFNV